MALVKSILGRLLVATTTWWALTEGDPSVAVYAAVAVPLVVGISFLVAGVPDDQRGIGARRAGSRLGAVARRSVATVHLAAWVGARSVTGGVDVARRVLSAPAPAVDPYWCSYTSSLPSATTRALCALIMNIMPGTLSAQIDGAQIKIHVIGTDLDVHSTLHELEHRIWNTLS